MRCGASLSPCRKAHRGPPSLLPSHISRPWRMILFSFYLPGVGLARLPSLSLFHVDYRLIPRHRAEDCIRWLRVIHGVISLINNKGLVLQWEGDAGSILINDTEYALKQAHWHSPSEHTINGRRYDMELHMVHLSIDNKIAVIAVLYNIGKSNHFLS
ncbi:hypothetical protein L1987_61156 [Smallanthus sonchifolius]|uniref:Uncharacterized protein n=1 Tax=Smallanthus sonchifolius TaxID=185202 RepID=A0ACB9DA94_9ASTR|nr:hypothetical protein L1987_61156 [Smallanthus sonchifolius]